MKKPVAMSNVEMSLGISNMSANSLQKVMEQMTAR
jgi:hypothetical protein